MKKLSNTKFELKKSVAYKKSLQFPRLTRCSAIWSVNHNKRIFVQSLMLPDIFQQERFIIEKRNLTRQKNKRKKERNKGTKTKKSKQLNFFMELIHLICV